MPTGIELTHAITNKNSLLDVDECFGAVVQLGTAIYGTAQNESASTEIRKKSEHVDADLTQALSFTGVAGQTAVWHFEVTNPVHHFAIMPFYGEGNVLEYSVLMAYVYKYSLRQYVTRTPPAPSGKTGYRDRWTKDQCFQMLRMINRSPSKGRLAFFADQELKKDDKLFRGTGPMKFYKYPLISIDEAYQNLANY